MMTTHTNRVGRLAALLLLLVTGGLLAAQQEVSLTDADFKRLDTFEGHELEKADKIFAAKDYRGAQAAYEAFMLQFPKSGATAYAALRKARCLHLGNKRFEAIKQYTDILDYWPNSVDYAGAALYFTGACHAENGEIPEAMKAWKEMADDVDYRKHFLAAGALNQLADNLVKQDKKSDANEYYKQAAIDFRKSNRDASWYALNKVVEYYTWASPNSPRLREFYDKVLTFEGDPRTPEDSNYWQRTRENIRKFAAQPNADQDQKLRMFRYWADFMDKLQPQWDDFQKDVSDYKLAYENDPKKWMARIDKQFSAYQKPDDYARIVRFIGYFQNQKDKVQEYYTKLTFDKMTNPQIDSLLRVLLDNGAYLELGRNVFGKLKLNDMPDNEKYNLERYLWTKDEKLVLRMTDSFADKDLGRMELLRYYHNRRNTEKGLKLADEMTKIPNYAKETWWLKAEMFQWTQKWQEAIQAYQAADNQPTNLWRIVDCQLGAGKREQALGQLREIENFFVDQAPQAAWRIAVIFRDSGEKDKYIAGLRGILKKYPKSGESSTAHQELQKMGVGSGGGMNAEDK